jgi:hypothetical protein
LATIQKVSQRKVNSGQKKKVTFIAGKCFPFDKKKKTLSFLYIKHNIFSNPCLSNFFPETIEAGTIEAYL